MEGCEGPGESAASPCSSGAGGTEAENKLAEDIAAYEAGKAAAQAKAAAKETLEDLAFGY